MKTQLLIQTMVNQKNLNIFRALAFSGLLVVFLAFTTACGKKGPLYLPEDDSKQKNTTQSAQQTAQPTAALSLTSHY